MNRYEVIIGDDNVEIGAESAEDAAAQARALLASYAEQRFAALGRAGQFINVPEFTISAGIDTLGADGYADYDTDEISVEITVAVPADIYRA